MGNYFDQTFQKCVLGTVAAIIQGREPSPSTQENCEVMKREAEEILQNPPEENAKKTAYTPKTASLDDLLKARAHVAQEFFKSYREYSKEIRKQLASKE